MHACVVESTRCRPGPAHRIVQFCAPERDEIIVVAACDEDLAVTQQRRSMFPAFGGEAAGVRPSFAHWVEEFRVRTKELAVIATYNEHFAVAQQRRRVLIVLVVKIGGSPPNSRDWIVEFGCGEVTEAVVATSDEHRAIGQQRGRVFRPFDYERPCGLKLER